MQKMHLMENGSSIYVYVFLLFLVLHLCITVDACRKQKAAPEYPLGGSSGEGIPAPIVTILGLWRAFSRKLEGGWKNGLTERMQL